MSNGLIVCNPGPLIALSLVGKLDLLHHLYDRVLVPEAVVREIVESGVGRAGAAEIKAASWLEAVRPLLETMAGQGYFLSRRLMERVCQEAGEAIE